MTSTKSFSTKNAGILVVAIFSIAISMGLSQVISSAVMAQTDIVDCSSEMDNESSDTEKNNTKSCADEEEQEKEESSDSENDSSDNIVRTVSTSSNNDEDDDEEEDTGSSESASTQPKNVVSTSPASADPEDNIIKPINLNKGFISDKPLKTNNMNNNQQEEDASESMKVIEDELEFKQQLDKTSSVSEVYESFDLPYTALYKNP
jgi:hypothetical protein